MNMNGSTLLNALQTLEPVSIEEISVKSRLPKEQVRNTLEWLVDIGIRLQWLSQNTVRLESRYVPLDPVYIRNFVTNVDSDIAARINVLESVDSTNEFLLNLGETHSIHKQVCIAEHMTEGRGRRRRNWSGGAFENVILSIAWDFREDIQKLSGLSLAVAVIVVKCLNQITQQNLQVKWPNDILWNERKLCGILVETKDTNAVVGVGVNFRLSDHEKNSISQSVACIQDFSDDSMERSEFVSKLICELRDGLELFSSRKLEPFREQWMQLHAYSNRKMRTDGNHPIEGTAVGLDEDGALLLKLSNGRVVPIRSGEVSVHESTD